MVMIPFGLFDPEETWFLVFMIWLTRLFWTLDIPTSFVSGFVTADGTIEMRPAPIAKKYIRSWLVIDAMVVSVDWLELILSNASEGLGIARIGKTSRIFRILRMIRLLRLAKVGEIVQLLSERFPSERIVIFADVLKLIMIMLGVGHFLACIWYAIGKSGPEHQNWLVEFGFAEETLDYRYIMSLRWALSQFAGGMDEVTPVSLAEHIYAGSVYLTAFWSGTVFLSILTSHMTQLYILGNQTSQKINGMQRYLRHQGISKALALRITRNAQHALKVRARETPEAAVGLVELVSVPLRIELHFEMYYPMLSRHPFFAAFQSDNPHVVRKVCHAAMTASHTSVGDVIFHVGETAQEMIFVSRGLLKYSSGKARHEILVPGAWLSEPCLWTPWTHRGMLTVVQDSQCFNLRAEAFQQIVNQYELGGSDPRDYAADFVARMNEELGDDLTDMGVDVGFGLRPASTRKKQFVDVRASVVSSAFAARAASARSVRVTSGNHSPSLLWDSAASDTSIAKRSGNSKKSTSPGELLEEDL